MILASGEFPTGGGAASYAATPDGLFFFCLGHRVDFFAEEGPR